MTCNYSGMVKDDKNGDYAILQWMTTMNFQLSSPGSPSSPGLLGSPTVRRARRGGRVELEFNHAD